MILLNVFIRIQFPWTLRLPKDVLLMVAHPFLHLKPKNNEPSNLVESERLQSRHKFRTKIIDKDQKSRCLINEIFRTLLQEPLGKANKWFTRIRAQKECLESGILSVIHLPELKALRKFKNTTPIHPPAYTSLSLYPLLLDKMSTTRIQFSFYFILKNIFELSVNHTQTPSW